MFEFDAGKLLIVGIVALIVIGPKELPRVMRYLGEALAKMRRMAADFRGQFLEAMREAEIDQAKSEVEMVADRTKADLADDPFAQLKADLTKALDAAEKPTPIRSSGLSPSTPPRAQEQSFTAIPPGGFEAADAALPAAVSDGAGPETLTAAAREVDATMRALTDALVAGMEKPSEGPAGSSKIPDSS